MNNSFIKVAAIAAAAVGANLLASIEAEAASFIEFSYDFDNGLGSVTGTVEGDVSSDGKVTNLTNLSATYSELPGVLFDRFSDTPSPVFSLGTIEEAAVFDQSVAQVLFAMTNEAGDEFQANSLITGQKAYLVNASTSTFVQDKSKFGTWTAKAAANGSKDIPEPGMVIGLMAMAGCLAPTFSKRRSA